MIQVARVSKSFGGVRAVREATFEVPRGQVVGLLGANGAGKSTTIRMITGFLPPDHGTISIGGHDTLTAAAQARRQVGYLPESAPSYSEMTTRDYLDFRGKLHGMDRRSRRSAMESALAQCDLTDVARRRIGHLSRGYRQRVGLAAAILSDPPALVLDEPTSALDPRQIRQVRTLIRELARTRAVLVSSHILPEVEQTCDRIVVMARGRIRMNAPPGELLARHREVSPLLVEIKGDAASFVRAVAQLPGIQAVESAAADAGWATLTIRGSGPLEETVGAAAATAGVILRRLHRATPSLERAFLELIETDDSDSSGGGA